MEEQAVQREGKEDFWMEPRGSLFRKALCKGKSDDLASPTHEDTILISMDHFAGWLLKESYRAFYVYFL